MASQNFEVRSFLTSLYEGLAIAAASTPEREDTDGEEDDGVMSEEDEDEAEDERQIAIDTLVFLVEVVADRASAIVRDYVARLCQQDEEDGCRTVQKLLNSPDVWNLAGPGKSTGGCWAVKELAEFRMRQLVRIAHPRTIEGSILRTSSFFFVFLGSMSETGIHLVPAGPRTGRRHAGGEGVFAVEPRDQDV